MVVAGGIRLESLELGVVPPTFAYAVVEKDTGKILFHSDERREFVANFIRSVGNSHHVLASFDRPTRADSLIRGNEPNIIDLHYDGVPIRALVSELRPEIPWRLVVYRGHEIDSRLSAISSSMAIFTLGIYFLIIVLIIFFAWFLLWLDIQKEGRESGGREQRYCGIMGRLGLDMKCHRPDTADFAQRPGLLRAMVERVLDVHIEGVLLWVRIKSILVILAMPDGLFTTLFACLLSDIGMLFWALGRPSSGIKHGESNIVSSFSVAFLLVGLVVLPTIAGFLHFRSALTWGGSQYIADQVRKRNVGLDDECRQEYVDYQCLRCCRHPNQVDLRSEGLCPYLASSCLRTNGLKRELVPSMRGSFDPWPGQGHLLQLAEPLVAHSALSKMIIQYSSFKNWAEGSKECPEPKIVVCSVPGKDQCCS